MMHGYALVLVVAVIRHNLEVVVLCFMHLVCIQDWWFNPEC